MNLTDQYRQMHEAGHFAGMSTLDWADDIGEMIREHGCKTVLDYGCGKGRQYTEAKLHERWGVEMPTLYDPGVPEFSDWFAVSGEHRYDAVICSDVLEHLEGNALHHAIQCCLTSASKAVFFSICCRPAKKLLPDGRNAHITIQPPTWWKGYIASACAGNSAAFDKHLVLRFET